MNIFKGTIIDAPTPKNIRIRNSYIGIEEGEIKFIEEKLPEKYQNNEVKELEKGRFIIPGFIDCHIHAPQYAFIGTAFGKPLLDWLKATVHNFEPKCSEIEYSHYIYNKIVSKTIENGTTTASYFATIHKDSSLLLAEICENKKQRALIGKVNEDINFPDNLRENTNESIEETIQFIEQFKNFKYVQPIITPRFAVSCTRELMQKLGDIANEKDIFIQTHLSESVNECDLIKSMFPECENYTDVYNKYNCLTSKTLLAHSIHLTDEEMDLIKQKGSSLIHCPNANLTMKSGFCPVKKALEKDLKIGMGTDVAGGFSVSMVESMKLALIVGNINDILGKLEPLDLSEVFYLATLGGAKCLDMENMIGSFEVGKKFDALIINLVVPNSPVELFDWNTENEYLERFVLQGDSRNIESVFVDGIKVN